MSGKLKTALMGFGNLILGFIGLFIFPTALEIALNRTHGAGNNPDGTFFAPAGWLLLLSLLLLLAVLWIANVCHVKINRLGKTVLLLFLGLFLLGALTAVLVTHCLSFQ